MKKTLLAVALAAGFAGAAQAETSVTLYGLIDAGLGYNQIKGPSGHKQSRFNTVDGVSSGSRFGLRGTEDLGDGLKAVFQLEGGFTSNNGNSAQSGRLFGRQATIGLDSDYWGRLEFGRQTNIASKYLADIDPFNLTYVTANMGSTFGAANTMRLDNMVMYQTPSFSGFKFGVGYSFNADDTTNSNFRTADKNRVVTTGLQYVNGPLKLVATYDRMNPDSSTDNDATLQQYILGGSYDFEIVKLAAAFGQTRDGWFVSTDLDAWPHGVTKPAGAKKYGYGNFLAKDGARVNSYMLGATVPLGVHTVFASWQRADPKNDRLGDDVSTDIFSLGYTYDLSKRTNLYAYASYADDYAFHEDVRSTAVAFGLRHRF